MLIKRRLFAGAIVAAFAPIAAFAQTQATTVTVSANPLGKEENMQVLSPTKILSGSELRAKVGSSLGETLGGELGVTASGFGAGASRPIIRGLEGPRVKILQNGMTVADVSSLSNDHAVASESAGAQQIEILRGPAALLYGSGAIGGLVNVVDGRIPTSLSKQVNGEVEVKYGSVNAEKSMTFFVDGSSGDVALHFDGNTRDSGDYKIPGYADAYQLGTVKGTLPSSFTHEHSASFGASLIQTWGHVGVAVQYLADRYGIPTEEKSFIKMTQTRSDIDAEIKQPFGHFDKLTFKMGNSNYQHTENEQDGTPASQFRSHALETRLSLSHANWDGWEGNVGIQVEDSKFSALSAVTGRADTIPTTSSMSRALFLVEQKAFGNVVASAGARLENVQRRPEQIFALPSRRFNLSSASMGAMWHLGNGYALVSSLSTAQRAPATEELYSHGPHEATLTFDIGDKNLKTENSKNLELSVQKTTGLVHWKINAFLNKVDNYVFGKIDGKKVNAEGEFDLEGEFSQRFWTQAAATVRGGEAELSYNQIGEGWSLRGFADTSHATLNQHGNLPLQPANRVGLDVGFRHQGWRNTLSVIHAQLQDRLASNESYATPAFTKVDLNVTYSQPYMNSQLTWFLQVKNLLNQDIRLATSVLKETVPQAMRGLIIGVRVSL